MDDTLVFICLQFITGRVLCNWVRAGSLTLVAALWVQWGFRGGGRSYTDQERNWVYRYERRYGHTGVGKEVGGKGRSFSRGSDFATETDGGRLLRWAGRRCSSTHTWRKSAFLENRKEMVWSLLLLDATLIFTNLFPFAFLSPVHVSIGYLHLQHCSVVRPMQWGKVCG